jgi:3-keto-L-gulonate-6-phosphate decarboxylase
MASPNHAASARVLDKLRSEFTFQISVDTDNLPQAYVVADAALKAGITLVEMGTPLLKTEGVKHVVPAFRNRYPDALILADMKSMDGAGSEARGVYAGGGNIIDFLALAGVASAKNVAAVRDEFRAADPAVPRLAFADILVPQQGPADVAVEVAQRMRDAGMDGVGLHLQLDARRADPALHASSYLADVARAVFAAVGDKCSVQVVGGLTIEQAKGLARDGLRAFVISGNFGLSDPTARYTAPAEEQTRLVADFIAQVSAV